MSLLKPSGQMYCYYGIRWILQILCGLSLLNMTRCYQVTSRHPFLSYWNVNISSDNSLHRSNWNDSYWNRIFGILFLLDSWIRYKFIEAMCNRLISWNPISCYATLTFFWNGDWVYISISTGREGLETHKCQPFSIWCMWWKFLVQSPQFWGYQLISYLPPSFFSCLLYKYTLDRKHNTDTLTTGLQWGVAANFSCVILKYNSATDGFTLSGILPPDLIPLDLIVDKFINQYQFQAQNHYLK